MIRKYQTGTQWCVWRWTHVSDYLTRLFIVKTPWFAVCLHWIHKADCEAFLHDHPVTFLSIILRGEYTETRQDGEHLRRWLNFIRATDKHSIIKVSPALLTLAIMGPKVREWGFHTDSGWQFWKDYYDAKGVA